VASGCCPRSESTPADSHVTDSLLPDAIFEAPAWIGQGGYWLGGDLLSQIPGGRKPADDPEPARAGGSTGWAELDTALAVAICHNRQYVVDRKDPAFTARTTPIADAVREVAHERAGAAR